MITIDDFREGFSLLFSCFLNFFSSCFAFLLPIYLLFSRLFSYFFLLYDTHDCGIYFCSSSLFLSFSPPACLGYNGRQMVLLSLTKERDAYSIFFFFLKGA